MGRSSQQINMRLLQLLSLTYLLLQLNFVTAQNQSLSTKDSVVTSSWIFGLGFNAVDDAGSEFSDFFNIEDNWNIVPFPSRLSIGRYFKNGLGLEAIGSYNRYKNGKTVDGVILQEDIDYYAVDFIISYDLNQILGDTGWFDPYIGLGAGYTDANNQGRGTYNTSIGFRTWISDRLGLDFSSTGKWAMNTENASNHIQHAAGVAYRFGIEKGLSKKGEEKLVLMREMEKEQQRIQDSIASSKQAEEEAKMLAERLKKEEAERLAQEERLKLEKENTDRKNIENQVAEIGNVYFGLNSSYLDVTSKAKLDALIQVLQENTNLRLQIVSHADARGSKRYNQWLSRRRSERIVSYLITNGVEEQRLQSEAFGEDRLTNDCFDGTVCNEEQHQANRRSEFRVIKKY